MKKKPAKKAIKKSTRTIKIKKTTASTRRSTARSRIKTQPQAIGFGRIIIFSSFAVLLIAVIVNLNQRPVTQTVAGISIFRGLFEQSTIQLPSVPDAAEYNIYYKPTSESEYTNAVRGISADLPSYTISYLKKGTEYQYKISALGSDGSEFWWSDSQIISNLQPM